MNPSSIHPSVYASSIHPSTRPPINPSIHPSVYTLMYTWVYIFGDFCWFISANIVHRILNLTIWVGVVVCPLCVGFVICVTLVPNVNHLIHWRSDLGFRVRETSTLVCWMFCNLTCMLGFCMCGMWECCNLCVVRIAC